VPEAASELEGELDGEALLARRVAEQFCGAGDALQDLSSTSLPTARRESSVRSPTRAVGKTSAHSARSTGRRGHRGPRRPRGRRTEAVVDDISRQVTAGLSDDQRMLYRQIEQDFAASVG